MKLSQQEYWSRLPCSPPGNLPIPGIKPGSPGTPVSAGRFFTTWATWKVPQCKQHRQMMGQDGFPGFFQPLPWVFCGCAWRFDQDCHLLWQAEQWHLKYFYIPISLSLSTHTHTHKILKHGKNEFGAMMKLKTKRWGVDAGWSWQVQSNHVSH